MWNIIFIIWYMRATKINRISAWGKKTLPYDLYKIWDYIVNMDLDLTRVRKNKKIKIKIKQLTHFSEK